MFLINAIEIFWFIYLGIYGVRIKYSKINNKNGFTGSTFDPQPNLTIDGKIEKELNSKISDNMNEYIRTDFLRYDEKYSKVNSEICFTGITFDSQPNLTIDGNIEKELNTKISDNMNEYISTDFLKNDEKMQNKAEVEYSFKTLEDISKSIKIEISTESEDSNSSKYFFDGVNHLNAYVKNYRHDYIEINSNSNTEEGIDVDKIRKIFNSSATTLEKYKEALKNTINIVEDLEKTYCGFKETNESSTPSITENHSSFTSDPLFSKEKVNHLIVEDVETPAKKRKITAGLYNNCTKSPNQSKNDNKKLSQNEEDNINKLETILNFFFEKEEKGTNSETTLKKHFYILILIMPEYLMVLDVLKSNLLKNKNKRKKDKSNEVQINEDKLDLNFNPRIFLKNYNFILANFYKQIKKLKKKNEDNIDIFFILKQFNNETKSAFADLRNTLSNFGSKTHPCDYIEFYRYLTFLRQVKFSNYSYVKISDSFYTMSLIPFLLDSKHNFTNFLYEKVKKHVNLYINARINGTSIKVNEIQNQNYVENAKKNKKNIKKSKRKFSFYIMHILIHKKAFIPFSKNFTKIIEKIPKKYKDSYKYIIPISDQFFQREEKKWKTSYIYTNIKVDTISQNTIKTLNDNFRKDLINKYKKDHFKFFENSQIYSLSVHLKSIHSLLYNIYAKNLLISVINLEKDEKSSLNNSHESK